MASRKRNIGREILEGIREINRGEHGRVTTVPSVSSVREKTGLSQADFARLLVWPEPRVCLPDVVDWIGLMSM